MSFKFHILICPPMLMTCTFLVLITSMVDEIKHYEYLIFSDNYHFAGSYLRLLLAVQWNIWYLVEAHFQYN